MYIYHLREKQTSFQETVTVFSSELEQTDKVPWRRKRERERRGGKRNANVGILKIVLKMIL